MKIGGARHEPVTATRRRGAAQAAVSASGAAAAARVDTVEFLGIPEAELTPAVRRALQQLLSEVDDLRGEVSQLKSRLTEAEGLADRDALTPLLNRRGFLRELSRVKTFAQRYGAQASLVYFDLDGFKAINDRYGHAAGDAALKVVAERILANVRDSDIVGRLGGDEFAVVLVQADPVSAEAKAASLARNLEREPLSFGEWTAPIGLSWGVAPLTNDLDPETALAAADAAMFEAKRLRKAG